MNNNPYTQLVTTLTKTHYYPFGMRISTISNQPINLGTERNNAYLYNGKLERSGNPARAGEFNDDFGLNWYDYGARFYDAQIARWHSVDPLAEKYFCMSPYNYVGNNPIMRIDPDGRSFIGAYGIMNNTGAADVYGGGDRFTFIARARAFKAFKNNIEFGENYFLLQGENPKGGGKGVIDHVNFGFQNIGGGNDYPQGDEGSVWLPEVTVEAANGGGDWHPPMALKEVGSAASYASGAIGLTQIGMLEYRMSLPIMSKIGTFGTFSSRYRGLGIASKTLGRTATYIGAPLSIGLDYSAYRSGDISLVRFGYRTGSLGVSIGTGAAIGGPWGAAAGAAVGGISVGAEYIYDNFLVPLGNEIQYQIWNFENAIRNGWYPGR